MSWGFNVLQMIDEDVLKFLATGNHLDATKLDFQMEQFINKRKQYICKSDGFYMRNLKRKKLLLTAQAMLVIENTVDVSVIIPRSDQWAVLMFGTASGVTSNTGCLIPGAFIKPTPAAFKEPHFLMVTSSKADHQALT